MRIKSIDITLLVALGVSLFLCRHLFAETTGASFLNIGTSARAVSMGNAFVGIANDVSAINYNPAGLARLDKKSVAAQHTEWLADTRHDFVAAAFPTRNVTLGFGAIYLSHGNIEGRDENRNVTDAFGASDLAVLLSCSRGITEATAVGANIKFIRQSIDNESATGVAVDVGAMRKITDTHLTVGVAVQNIGPQMKFVSEGYNLPLSIAVGAGYDISDLTFAADIKQRVYEGSTSLSFGAEYLPVSMIALRVGYMLPIISPSGTTIAGNDLTADKLNPTSAFAAGFGLNILGFSTDYAFTPYGDVGSAHRVSFSFKF